MSMTGLEAFDKTLNETNRWLLVVMNELETDNRKLAFAALRATLHALRDRIEVRNAVHLGSQLPMLLRGVYYEGWHLPEGSPRRHAESFIDHVASALRRSTDLDPVKASKASFAALTQCIEDQEVKKLMSVTPVDTWLLWPAMLEEAMSLGTH